MTFRTESELRAARTAIVRHLTTGKLSKDQTLLLQGMSVALCWAMDEGGDSLQRLIDGEPVAYGDTASGR